MVLNNFLSYIMLDKQKTILIF